MNVCNFCCIMIYYVLYHKSSVYKYFFALSALYICVTAFIFLILPFVYFFYEEKDEETTTKSVSSCATTPHHREKKLYSSIQYLIPNCLLQ